MTFQRFSPDGSWRAVLRSCVWIAILLAFALTVVVAPGRAEAQTQAPAQAVAPEWRLVCAADAPEPSPRLCQLRYELTSDSGRRVLRVTIGLTSGEGEPTWFINALLPLGLYIPSGAGYVVDGAPAVPLQLQECTPQGCRAIGALPPERLQALKDGLEIQFVFADSASRKGIGLSVSLVGFTAAVEAMLAVGD